MKYNRLFASVNANKLIRNLICIISVLIVLRHCKYSVLLITRNLRRRRNGYMYRIFFVFLVFSEHSAVDYFFKPRNCFFIIARCIQHRPRMFFIVLFITLCFYHLFKQSRNVCVILRRYT